MTVDEPRHTEYGFVAYSCEESTCIGNGVGAEDNPAEYGKDEGEEHLGGFTERGE